MNTKKGILVVSFGTSYEDTRKKTIEAIEDCIRNKFTEYQIYQAFTSKIILKKLKAQGLSVYTVEEALVKMLQDGILDLVVQPTHIINGIENDCMLEDVKKYAARFQRIAFGKPLLTDTEDYKELAKVINQSYKVEEDEMLLLMGHGSDHHANACYPAFAYTLKQCGYPNVVIGTVEGYPSFEDAYRNLEKSGKKKVCLVPMMIVAGEHACKDMAGEEDSWKSILKQKGYQVRCLMSGLGELTGVQQMFIRHVEEAIVTV